MNEAESTMKLSQDEARVIMSARHVEMRSKFNRDRAVKLSREQIRINLLL